MFIFMFENRSLDELQLEKKHLHEYLKVYERYVAKFISFLYKLKSVFVIMFSIVICIVISIVPMVAQ